MWKNDRTSRKSEEMMDYNVKTELGMTIEIHMWEINIQTPSGQGGQVLDQARILSTERLKDARLSQTSLELGDKTAEKSLHYSEGKDM